jgi:hypothetical protein
MLLVANTYPIGFNGAFFNSIKWIPYFVSADNHTILPNVQLSGPTGQGTTGTCPSNTYDVYISVCDFSKAIGSYNNVNVRALKMCGPTGCASFTIADPTSGATALSSDLLNCDNLICWVVDPTNTYSKPIIVHIMSYENQTRTNIRFSWSASSQFLQNQTIFNPFAVGGTAPLWVDANGRTGTIGSYAGQTGVTGGRILLAGANNSM